MMTLIKFGAPWCVKCKQVDPDIHSLQERYPELNVVDWDMDAKPDANGLRIMTIPQFALYRGEELVLQSTNLLEIEGAIVKVD